MDELNRKTISEFHSADKFPLIIVLDNVRSMHNVGSVFRTADAFLAKGIWLCGFTPKPPHRDIHKTALGATETVQWEYMQSCLQAVESLNAEGYETWAVEQAKGSLPLSAFGDASERKIAVIFGNEVEGVQSDILRICKGCIEIPQLGMKHSLNVSVAAGIVLWELVRSQMNNVPQDE